LHLIPNNKASEKEISKRKKFQKIKDFERKWTVPVPCGVVRFKALKTTEKPPMGALLLI